MARTAAILALFLSGASFSHDDIERLIVVKIEGRVIFRCENPEVIKVVSSLGREIIVWRDPVCRLPDAPPHLPPARR